MITAPKRSGPSTSAAKTRKLRDRYGRTAFGQRLLLSRRLIEAGVRFVTVSDNAWDNHQDCFNALKNQPHAPGRSGPARTADRP